MAKFALVLEFDRSGRRFFAARGWQVVLAKPTGIARPNVAWLAWEPLARNTITWDETYGLYAAEMPASARVPIRILSTVHPAVDRMIYPFAGGSFGEPDDMPHLPPRHYNVRNEAALTTTFGLLQEASLNGESRRSPLNAIALPREFTADFTPTPTVYVWAQGAIASGSIAQVPDEAMAIPVDGTERRYRYDAKTKSFEPSDLRPNWRKALLRRARPPLRYIAFLARTAREIGGDDHAALVRETRRTLLPAEKVELLRSCLRTDDSRRDRGGERVA